MNERLHTRSINVNTYDIGNGQVLVEGSLTDTRHSSSMIQAKGEIREPGIIHDMIVRMTVSVTGLRIVAIEAEMPVIPLPDCAEIKDAVEKLKDLEIKHGFTDEVQRRLGKTQGCIHMMNLVLAMGSAAVQGVWSYYARHREGAGVRRPAGSEGMLIDSCWVWRKDGPLAGKWGNPGKE